MHEAETVPLEVHVPSKAVRLSTSLLFDILLASAANAVNQADRNIMPIAVIPMAEAFDWTMLQRGLILSSFAYGYILSQLPGGWIATRLPPLHLLLVAVTCWSLATLLTPAAAGQGLGAGFGCRVVMGVAEGFCLPAIFQLFAARVPEQLRARAFSLMLGAGSVGQLGALLLCPQLSPWPAMFTFFGAAGLGWAVLCTFRLWRGPPPSHCEGAAAAAPPPSAAAGTDEAGRGGGAAASDEDEIAELVPRGCGQSLEPGGGGRRGLAARLLRCRPLHAICLAHFAQNWTNYTLSSWLPTYLHEQLAVPTQQLSLTALPFAVNAAANVGFGLAADRAAAYAASPRALLRVRRAATLTGLLGPALCHCLFPLATSAGLAIAIVTLSFLLGGATASGYMANHADLSRRYAGLTFAIANTAQPGSHMARG